MASPRASVTVVTGTIPGREVLLGECIASVFAQSREVEGHVIYAQSCTEGLWPPHHCALQQNVALAAVETEFCMRLADDDKLSGPQNQGHREVPLVFCGSGTRPPSYVSTAPS